MFCFVLFKAYEEFFSQDQTGMCGDLCPLECSWIFYNQYTSFADYPSTIYASSLQKNPRILAKFAANFLSQLTHESLKRNVLELSVFYGDLGYEKYEEVADVEWLDLVSNIGGTLGLFIGMSFLSFVEIFDVLLQVILRKTNKSSSRVLPS